MCVCVFVGWFRRDACFGHWYKSSTSALHHHTLVLHLLLVPVSSGVLFFLTSNQSIFFVSIGHVIFNVCFSVG